MINIQTLPEIRIIKMKIIINFTFIISIILSTQNNTDGVAERAKRCSPVANRLNENQVVRMSSNPGAEGLF